MLWHRQSGLEYWLCDRLQVTWPFHASVDWAGVYSEHGKLWNQELSVTISTNSIVIPEITKPKLSIMNVLCAKHYMGFNSLVFKVLSTQTHSYRFNSQDSERCWNRPLLMINSTVQEITAIKNHLKNSIYYMVSRKACVRGGATEGGISLNMHKLFQFGW